MNEARRIPALYLRLGATPCGVPRNVVLSSGPKWCVVSRLASLGSGRWIRALGSADPRHTCPAFCPPGTHPRRGHGPPPRRTAGTTLSSTLADAARRAASSASVCEHLLIRRCGAGRPFASAPPALGFVCELSVHCGMPRGTSRGLRQRQSMHWCEASQQQALYTVGRTNYGFRPLTCTERELLILTRSPPLNAFALAAAATFRASAHPKRVHAPSPFRF